MAAVRVASRLLLACVALCGTVNAVETTTATSSWCHGVAVAPQRALVTAQCAQQASVVVLVKKSGDAVAIQRTQGDLRSYHEPLTGDAGITSSAFAVVDLELPIDINSVLIQLDTTASHTNPLAPGDLLRGFSLQESDRLLSSAAGHMVMMNSFNATVVSIQHCEEDQVNSPLTTQDTVACVLEQWSDAASCASSASHERTVTRVVQGHTYVYGFTASASSLSTSSSTACSSSGSRAALARLVTADLVARVQSALSGRDGSQSTEGTVITVNPEDVSSPPITIQEPSSSIVVSNSAALVDLPPKNITTESEPTDSLSSTRNEPTGETIEAPVISLQSSLPSNYALLSSSPNASAGAFTVAALIAPRFLVANAEWWASSEYEKGSSLWAVFYDNKRVRVRRVWAESEFYIQSSNISTSAVICDQGERACSLVVFELERAVVFSTATPFKIANSMPPLGVDLADTQLSVYDLALMRRGQSGLGFSSFAIEDQSVCSGDLTQVVPGLQCLDSTDPIETSESLPIAPFKTSFATSGEDLSLLLGLSGSDEMQLRLGKRVSQEIIELSATHHRQFLDSVTGNSVKWSRIEPAEDKSYSDVMSAVVNFYDRHNALECGGVTIAPMYILTTASCVESHKISALSVGQSSSSDTKRANRVEIENAFQIFSHPLYSSSQPLSRYNIALIELKTATLDVYMDLDNEVRGSGTRISRMETSSGSCRPEMVQETDSCVATGLLGSNADLNGLVCAHELSNTVDNVRNQLLLTPRGSLLLHKTMNGLLLVGLELPASAAAINPELSVYVSVFDAKRFIKAFASGYSWGSRPQASFEFGKLPSATKKVTKQPVTTLLDSQRYVVGLRVSKSGHNFCGGSLVAPTTVLTAAHCVTDGLANWVSVGSSASSGSDAELIKVLNVRVHPLYGLPGAYSYDAAILELAAGAYAPTVALDNSVDFADSVTGTMFGYGVDDTATASSATLSPSVHILSLRLWSRGSCAKVLPDVDDSFLCAGGKANDDACSGDSGSPLVVTGRDGKDYLVGLVSAGYGCGIEGVPGLYTRTFAVAAFVSAYVVQPTWRYPDAAGWASNGQADTTSQSLRATSKPTSRPSGAQDAGSQSQFPKLEPRTSAGSTLSDTEDREATGNSPLTVAPPSKVSIAAAALAYESALSEVTLRENLSPSVKKSVLDFVLGKYDHTIVSGALFERLLDVMNQISLFSSGNLDDLVAVIERHDALPLNRRKNRFGTMGQKEDEADKHCT